MKRALWAALGATAVVLGILGVVLPILPTTPFMLLAAGCFAKSSPTLHHWLLNHRYFGPPIRDWQNHGAIRPKAKRNAVIAMVSVFAVSLMLGLRWPVLLAQGLAMAGAATFILTRPAGPKV